MHQPGFPLSLFAYGSLTLPEVMQAVTGRSFCGQPAKLEGYGCYLLRGRSYPGIKPEAGTTTHGMLYEGLDEAAWRLLDAFEDDDCYVKTLLTVKTTQGRRRQAAAYVVKAGFYPALSPQRWSAEDFRRHCLSTFLAAIGDGGFDRC